MSFMADDRIDLPPPLAHRWQAARRAVAAADDTTWDAFLTAHPDVAALADAIAEHYHHTGRMFD